MLLIPRLYCVLCKKWLLNLIIILHHYYGGLPYMLLLLYKYFIWSNFFSGSQERLGWGLYNVNGLLNYVQIGLAMKEKDRHDMDI